jgi:hypothetical protein
MDAAIVTPSSETDVDGYSNWIEGESHGPIMGHVTRDGIDDLLSKETDETVFKMGITTCKTEGLVEEMENI